MNAKVPSKPILTLRQRVILSHVWSLAQEERMLLDVYKKFYITADKFVSHSDTEHACKDYISLDKAAYEIKYVNTGFNEISEMSRDTKLLISARINLKSKFFVMLVLKDPKPNQLTDETPQYLVGEGVQ